MNTYNVNDKEFLNSNLYKEFIENNPSRGSLRIRAYAASGAIPISGLKVQISTNYLDNKIIFFEGYTDESGVIERVSLPTPELDSNNLDVPNKTVYEVLSTYQNMNQLYEVNMYEGVCVIQNINVVPDLEVGGFNGN